MKSGRLIWKLISVEVCGRETSWPGEGCNDDGGLKFHWQIEGTVVVE